MINHSQVMGKVKAEGNHKQWDEMRDERTYRCVIARHPKTLHLNGYVGINKKHPLFKNGSSLSSELECHGGITCTKNGFRDKLCVLHEDPDWLVFGFDTGHYDDYAPNQDGDPIFDFYNDMVEGSRTSNATYKDWEFVVGQINKIINQLENRCK